jgi:arylsulfatase
MKRPNILLMTTDQQRWDALAINGNPDIKTPNLDKLARQGVNFDHYFVQNPVCMPSRLSFLTGQYPSTLGITHMAVPVPEETVTLPRLLRPYGYRCANIGKLHFLPHANRDHRIPHPDYGFDHLEISDEPGVYEDAYRAWVRRVAPEQLDHLSIGLPPATKTWIDRMDVQDTVKHPNTEGRFDFAGAIPFPGDERYTHSAFVAEQTIDYLQQQDGNQPFLCIAGFFSPHAPWVVPQRFLDMYDPNTFTLPQFPDDINSQRDGYYTDERLRAARHGYYAMVTEVDFQVGRILDQLEQQGLAENTIVVFTSDHGEWLGEHLKYGKGHPGDDAVSRVPCLIRAPGLPKNGETINHIVEAVDVLPTLLDLAAIQVPPHLQGDSLYGLLNGDDAPSDNLALMEFTGWKTLRSDQFRYLIHDDGKEQLWDLERGMGEYHDVASNPDYAAALAEQRRLLLQRLLQMERPLPGVWPY